MKGALKCPICNEDITTDYFQSVLDISVSPPLSIKTHRGPCTNELLKQYPDGVIRPLGKAIVSIPTED